MSYNTGVCENWNKIGLIGFVLDLILNNENGNADDKNTLQEHILKTLFCPWKLKKKIKLKLIFDTFMDTIILYARKL